MQPAENQRRRSRVKLKLTEGGTLTSLPRWIEVAETIPTQGCQITVLPAQKEQIHGHLLSRTVERQLLIEISGGRQMLDVLVRGTEGTGPPVLTFYTHGSQAASAMADLLTTSLSTQHANHTDNQLTAS